MMDINVDLLQWFINFFEKTTSGSVIKNENMSDQQFAEELYKPIIRNFGKRKVHSSFIDKIWGADLADMQLVSKFYKGIFVFYNV